MADDDAGNLEIQKKINDLLNSRSAMLAKHSEELKSQALLAVELGRAMRGDDLDEISGRIAEISSSLDMARQSAEMFSGGMSSAAKEASELGGSVEESSGILGSFFNMIADGIDFVGSAFDTVASTLLAPFEMLGSVISGIWDLFTGFLGSIAGFVTDAAGGVVSFFTDWEYFKSTLSGIYEVSKSVVQGVQKIYEALWSIPMSIFDEMMDAASELANTFPYLRQEMERVRGAFGDLAKAESAQVIGTFEQISQQSDNIAGTGLKLSQIYGFGPEALAKALADVKETAAAMGPVFGVLAGEFATSGAQLIMLQKGLGLTGEAMQGVGSYALAMGETLEDTLMENANLALQLGEKFGISSKLIGQDLGYMQSNMGKFGSITKTQMATAATYVRKLGLEIKQLEGLMGAFDDFETAATAASKLAQSFGMNVDAMQMMQEQDPAKRLDMLRQSFAATGKSIENMSRQEKALLAQTAGLDENTVALALSTENMGLSYDEVAAASEEAADAQKSEAEIMLDIAQNIEQVITNMYQTTSSFFETFFNGFMMGVSSTEEFRAAINALANALRATFDLGRRVGEIFVKSFPGVSKVLEGITKSFGEEFIAKLDVLSGAFDDFFTMISEDPVEAFKNLFLTFQKLFYDPLSPESEGQKMIKEGMQQFFSTVAEGAVGFVDFVLEAIVDSLDQVINYLNGESGEGSEVSESWFNVIIGSLTTVFERLLPVLKEKAPKILKQLSTILFEAAGQAWDFAWPLIEPYWNAAIDKMKNWMLDKLKDMALNALIDMLTLPLMIPKMLFSTIPSMMISMYSLLLKGLFSLGAFAFKKTYELGESIIGGLKEGIISLLSYMPSLSDIFGSLGKIFTDLFSGEGDNSDSLYEKTLKMGESIMGGLIDGIKEMINYMPSMPDVFGSLGSMFTGLFSGSDVEESLPSSSEIKGSLSGVTDALASYKDDSLTPTVEAILTDIKDVNDALAQVGEIDINATIDKLGEALSLKSEVLKIENKPIEMHVTLNLTMKAEDIAKEIMDVTAKVVKDSNKASSGMKDLFPQAG